MQRFTPGSLFNKRVWEETDRTLTGQEMAGVSKQRSGSFIDKVPDTEGSGTGSIDPVLGQESSHCQSLIRITISQETTEPPSPKVPESK